MSLAVEESDALTPAQRSAISNIRQRAQDLRADAVMTISHILNMSNVEPSTADAVRAAIRDHAHVVIHFHPDRPVGSRVVARALLEDGVYRNQFETGISNGLVSTALDGPRDSWEKSLFSGAYHDGTGLRAAERPKYGALDLTCHPDGPAPRFGSCYLVLKPEVSRRSTFTFGGSQADPKFRGTIDEFDAILSAILEESFTRDFMLGVSDIRPGPAMCLLRKSLTTPRQFRTDDASHNLDHMVEAQVHGDICLDRDVEALIADGPFFAKPSCAIELHADLVGDHAKQYGEFGAAELVQGALPVLEHLENLPELRELVVGKLVALLLRDGGTGRRQADEQRQDQPPAPVRQQVRCGRDHRVILRYSAALRAVVPRTGTVAS